MRTFRLIVILMLLASLPLTTPVMAKSQSSEGETKKPIKTRRTPTMRESVYKKLSAAQIAAEEERFDDALKEIGAIAKIKKLNSYELAQMHSFYAYIYYSQENYTAAIDSYRQVLAQEDLPEALQLSTLYTLAQLYLVEENYQSAVDYLNQWFGLANSPNGSAYYLLATCYYQLAQYRNALTPIKSAIALAGSGGTNSRSLETWYVLLRGLYFELEESQNFADVLVTMTRLFPKKEYWMQLSSAYGQLEDDDKQLMTLEFVYLQGMFDRSQEYTNLAQLLMQADLPHRGSLIMEEGFDKGLIKQDERNLRLLSQSYVMAQDDAKAIVPLAAAAKLTEGGQLYYQLASSQLNLQMDAEAAASARKALDKGGLRRRDQVYILLGMALYNQGHLNSAKEAFREAVKADKRSRKVGTQWVTFIGREQDRLKQLEDY